MVAPRFDSSLPCNNSTANNVPSEEEMGTMFDTAMKAQEKSGSTKASVSPAEQQKFLSAMKDPAFRSLLNDYMTEISDPRHRRETERYLSQLEGEQKVPVDKQLIKPSPGFVVKTQWNATEKIFINICSHGKLQPPSSTHLNASKKQGTTWHLPYSLGPERYEVDKSGQKVATFDVCFHPRVLDYAFSQGNYRHMVINTSLEAVESKLQDTRRRKTAILTRTYHILKGVVYKSGDPVTMCIRREETAQKQEKQKSEVEKKSSFLTPVSTTEKVLQPKAKQKKMTYQLIYRGNFDLSHHLQAEIENQLFQERSRPKTLVIKVTLPEFTSAQGLDLDISDDMLRLTTDPTVCDKYEPLEVSLPFPVVKDKGSAKFDRQKHTLIVTLPVQPPPKPTPVAPSLLINNNEEEEEKEEEKEEEEEKQEPSPSRLDAASKSPEILNPIKNKEEEDEFRMFRETALMVANDPQVLAYNQRQNPAASSSSDTFDTIEAPSSVQRNKLEMNLSKEIATTALTPPFQTQSTPTCVSYIIDVANIDATSVNLTFPSKSTMELNFLDKYKHVYHLHVAKLSEEMDPSSAETDVASENMVVLLHKRIDDHLSASKSPQKLQKLIQIDPLVSISAIEPTRFQNTLLYELD